MIIYNSYLIQSKSPSNTLQYLFAADSILWVDIWNKIWKQNIWKKLGDEKSTALLERRYLQN